MPRDLLLLHIPTRINLMAMVYSTYLPIAAIQVLRNAVGVGVSAFPEKFITKVYGSTLLALLGGGCGSNFQEKIVT